MVKISYLKPMYLATFNINRYEPARNHGWIEIDDSGILSCGTPVEDFGGYILQDTPFPTDQNQLDQMFFDLMAE